MKKQETRDNDPVIKVKYNQKELYVTKKGTC